MSLSSSPLLASPTVRRRPRQGRAATAAVVAALVVGLASAPLCVHAVGGGLRRGPGPSEHMALDDHDSQLLADEETLLGEPSKQEERTLVIVTDKQVPIGPFRTNLLATNFPYPMKYNRENEISGAVGFFLARYLDETLDGNVLNLGVDCSKSQRKVGPETRWVLDCEGAAMFDEIPDKKDLTYAVRGAFLGKSKHDFFEIMYPKYEMLHEKKEWDLESQRRQGGKKWQKRKKAPKRVKLNKKNKPNKKKPNKNKPNKNKPSKNKPNKNKPNKNKPDKNKPNKNKPGKYSPMKQNSQAVQTNNSNSIDIHNVNGLGVNVMGYVSGSQSKPGNGNVKKNGDIIVKVRGGGRRDRE